MNILITAGNTHAPIDRVRVITNVFTGATGAHLACTAYVRGHNITVLTSQPYTLSDLPEPADDPGRRAVVVPYRTFDDLAGRFQHELRTGGYDCVIHSAVLSDYLSAGVYAPDAGTFFNARTRHWERRGGPPAMSEAKAGKIGTSEPEMWIRLVRAPRLVDRVRTPWGFAGLLVEFRLEVGVGDHELVGAAEQARAKTAADLIVASTLEGSPHYAYMGPLEGKYERVDRRELGERLLVTVEQLHRGRVKQNG